MAYAVGHVSGGHFNPAVTIGLATSRRFAWREVPGYVVAQVVASAVAAAVLFVIANGQKGFSASESGFATNGYADRSPGGYTLLSVVVAEVVLTAFFVYVILGSTDTRAPKGFAPLTIGLSLTLIHLGPSRWTTPRSTRPARPGRPCSPGARRSASSGSSGWLRSSAARLIAGARRDIPLFGKDAEAVPLTDATGGLDPLPPDEVEAVVPLAVGLAATRSGPVG